MSALLDNVINGNRNAARDIIRRKNSRATAVLLVIDLIEDLIDTGKSPQAAIDDVRSLCEPL